jgi:tRNA U34 5-carboxymethylaminomethyl modifying GTPase MnmE/TrmE
MYKEKIVNALTGEETWRDYTDAEIAEVEAAQAEAAKQLVEAEAKEAARQAVLTKLGLTAEEAQALLG